MKATRVVIPGVGTLLRQANVDPDGEIRQVRYQTIPPEGQPPIDAKSSECKLLRYLALTLAILSLAAVLLEAV